MRYLIVVIAVMFAFSASPVEARQHQYKSLWTPGIIMRWTFEGLMMNNSGPRLVWRGDWVPTNKRDR